MPFYLVLFAQDPLLGPLDSAMQQHVQLVIALPHILRLLLYNTIIIATKNLYFNVLGISVLRG